MTKFTKEQAGKTHNLKIWPEYFAAVRAGLKRAELRWNDREYQAGDILDLCEWDPNEEAFTGEYISVNVTHVAELGQWMPGYVLLSIALPALATSPVQEPVADVVAWSSPTEERTCDIRWRRHDVEPGPLFTAPQPVAAAIPDEMAISADMNLFQKSFAQGYNTFRAAMLHREAEVSEQPRKYWYLVCWDSDCGKHGTTEIWLDHPWGVGDMREVTDDVSRLNNANAIIKSVFPIAAEPQQEAE